jgi:hypothetical protein
MADGGAQSSLMTPYAEQVAKGIVLAATTFLREIEPNLKPHDATSWVERIIAFERPSFMKSSLESWRRDRSKSPLMNAVYTETLGMYRESFRNGQVFLRKDIERHIRAAVTDIAASLSSRKTA